MQSTEVNQLIEDIKEYIQVIHPSDWYLEKKLNKLQTELKNK